MENNKDNSKTEPGQVQEANCNVSIARPFFIFVGVAAILAVVAYLIFK